MYSEQYDESIDVYAFGMCLLEMATGEYPYQECTKPFEIYKRVTKGVRPDNYYRIDNPELQELIDLCIRLKKNQRPNVRELVNYSWFMDNNGLHLELHKDEKTKKIFYTNESQILFRLKLIDKSKHMNWPDNEAIEFIFDVDTDVPETIAKELKDNVVGKINDEDLRYLVQSIKNKCLVFKLEREDRLEQEELLAGAAVPVTATVTTNIATQSSLGSNAPNSNASTLTNVSSQINSEINALNAKTNQPNGNNQSYQQVEINSLPQSINQKQPEQLQQQQIQQQQLQQLLQQQQHFNQQQQQPHSSLKQQQQQQPQPQPQKQATPPQQQQQQLLTQAQSSSLVNGEAINKMVYSTQPSQPNTGLVQNNIYASNLSNETIFSNADLNTANASSIQQLHKQQQAYQSQINATMSKINDVSSQQKQQSQSTAKNSAEVAATELIK